MNRRSFLGRLAVGAAAVLGLGAVKAGTAEASTTKTVTAEQLEKIVAYRSKNAADLAYAAGFHAAASKYETIRPEPPTFEAMQADCAARGCSFTYEHATGPDGRRWAKVTHGGTQKHWHLDFSGGEAVILDQIDAERRELHED